MTTRQLIRADGVTVDLLGPLSMAEIHRLIGAETLDTVSLRHMGSPLHVMCVNDNGWETETVTTDFGIELRPVRALLPINTEATRLYRMGCTPGTAHQIAGDVVVVPDEDFA